MEQMPITDDMVVRRVRAAVKIALEKNKAMGVPSIVYDRIASVAGGVGVLTRWRDYEVQKLAGGRVLLRKR